MLPTFYNGPFSAYKTDDRIRAAPSPDLQEPDALSGL